ncbi:MAG: hypothetical protein RI538_07665 [Salibaculum sp.]|uniref:hypothetical protein n=1 Tax=Salibaculum sp. TaxID=2855480 RepID=UPI0028704B63|nr:hypothetical protein [Salibaculum sp.]MDR9428289.1 hypothetical protein [Salibaculum sp.]MDR9482648.1 hypothetical protein [Salibaculum sp.]
MLISRILAKRRIAAGVRPGWLAAWGPVALDAACLVAVFALAFGPFRGLVAALEMPRGAVIAALVALGFIPVQGVLIISSLWAARSRWQDKETEDG